MTQADPESSAAFVQGASGGIGTAIVQQLLAKRSRSIVYASCRSPALSPELTELASASAGRLEVLPVDVELEATVEAAAATIAKRGQRLDLIVNCSGVLHDDGLFPEKRLSEVHPEALGLAFRVNALGPLLVLKHLASLLPRHDRSVVASLSARVGSIGDNALGGWYGYRASKAALNMLMHTASIELARSHPGCACVLVHPGTVDTGLSKPFQERVAKERLFSPERAARQILEVLNGVGSEDSGRFLAWDGSEIPW